MYAFLKTCDFPGLIRLISLGTHSKIDLGWMLQNLTNEKWTLVQVMLIRQQTTTWANADPDLCRHMASLGHNELIRKICDYVHGIWQYQTLLISQKTTTIVFNNQSVFTKLSMYIMY